MVETAIAFGALIFFLYIGEFSVDAGCPFAARPATPSLRDKASARRSEIYNGNIARRESRPRFWSTEKCNRKKLHKACRKMVRADRGSKVPDLLRALFHDHQACSLDGSLRFELERAENFDLEGATEKVEAAARKSKCSVADAFALCAIKALRYTGGPRIRMTWGHKDAKGPNPRGRMPPGSFKSHQDGAFILRSLLLRYTDEEIVLLSSAHNIGHFHLRDSNDDVFEERPFTTNELRFTNEYFRNLKHVHLYGRAPRGTYQLPSDLVLIEDASFRRYVMKYAHNERLYFKKFGELMGRMIGDMSRCDAVTGPPELNKYRDNF